MPSRGYLEAVVVATVALSTLLHGLTAYPLARRCGAYASGEGRAGAEWAEAMEHPVRVRHGAGA